MVSLLIRIPCCAEIDLSGKCFSRANSCGKRFISRVQVQLVDPGIGGSCNYHDWFIRRECRPDYRHAPYHHDHAFYGITSGHSLDVTESRHGSISLGRIAGYLYGCADPEATNINEEGDCAILTE